MVRAWGEAPLRLRSTAAPVLLVLALAGAREALLALDEPRRWEAAGGRPFEEYVQHTIRARRVEYRHYGAGWAYAQAIVEIDDEPCLVYEVDDPGQAASCAGITAEHAQRTLLHLIERASSLVSSSVPSPSTCASSSTSAAPTATWPRSASSTCSNTSKTRRP